MSGTKKNLTDATIMLTERDMVREVVFSHRSAGQKIDHAFEAAASQFGLNRHWVRKLMRGEMFRIEPRKLRAIRAGYVSWIRADIEKQRELLAANCARLSAIEENAHFEMAGAESRKRGCAPVAFGQTA